MNPNVEKLNIGTFVILDDSIGGIPSRFQNKIGRVSKVQSDNTVGAVSVADYRTGRIDEIYFSFHQGEYLSEEDYHNRLAQELKSTWERFQPYKDSIRNVFPTNSVIVVENEKIVAYVRFPKVEMTNEDDAEHTIEDLVFQFIFNSDLTISMMSTSRYSATPEEIAVNYGHSHSGTGCLYGFTHAVCLGETPLNDAYLNLKTEANFDYFELFLHQISDYVKYESLNGGPYVEIASVGCGLHIDDSSEDDRPDYSTSRIEALILKERVKIKFTSGGSRNGVQFGVHDYELSDSLLSNDVVREYLEERDLIGKMINDNFYLNISNGSGRNQNQFRSSPALHVSDEVNAIDLDRTILSSQGLNDSGNDYVNTYLLGDLRDSMLRKLNNFLIKKQLNA